MSNNLDNFSWKNLHVYLLPNPIIKFTHSTDKEIQQKVIEVGEVFTSNGAKVRFLDDSVFTNAFEIWKCEIYQRLDYSLRKIITNGKDVNLLKELLLMSFRKSKMTLPAIISCLWEDFFKPSKKQILLGLQKSRTVLSSLSKVLDNNSIIVMPVYPTSAMRHNNPIIYPIDWIYSGIFNALNLPAVSIPMGLNTHKLPLGIQIISAAHNDILILKAAELFDNK
jgi:fatty acid amide hydrolase 2